VKRYSVSTRSTRAGLVVFAILNSAIATENSRGVTPEKKAPLGKLTYRVNDLGRPFTIAGFGNKMGDWCDEAGLPQCSTNGLRKASRCDGREWRRGALRAVRLVEAGAAEIYIARRRA
jgi:hypothetical protein